MRIALLLLASTALAADLRWVAPASGEVEINGLPWLAENHGELIRLPLRLKAAYRQDVWDLAQSPSGGRIRFSTDSKNFAVRLEYPYAPSMRNMHAFGQSGVDLYVGGVYIGTATADNEAAPGKVYERAWEDRTGGPRVERDVTLYLPLYMPVKVLAIGVDKDAKIGRAAPFAVSKPVVFYGTSITQGGCASRPGMSYQAILGRMLNLDFVNLGFSGNGKGEPEVARTVAEIDAACFVLDFAQNNETVESLRAVYGPFMETLRAKHPETPILAVTPIYAAREAFGEAPPARLEPMRELIRQVAAARIAKGDGHLQIVEGTDLLGPAQGAGLVDGTHPNDLGFEWMAEGFATRLRKVLRLR